MNINEENNEIFIRIGQLLRYDREEKKISLEDVSNDLKIRKKHLEAIEEGNAQNVIQGEYFLYNFIKKYSQYLNFWDNIYDILNDSKVLNVNTIGSNKNNELKKYNKNTKTNKYFFWIKLIFTILIILAIIIGIILWQKKSHENSLNKDLERTDNFNKQLQTSESPMVEDNTQLITIPLKQEENNFNNTSSQVNSTYQQDLQNDLSFQNQLSTKDDDELTIKIKYNTLLIITDSTGKEFINKVAKGGSVFSFLGVPPYFITVGWLNGTTIYKGSKKIEISNKNINNKSGTIEIK